MARCNPRKPTRGRPASAECGAVLPLGRPAHPSLADSCISVMFLDDRWCCNAVGVLVRNGSYLRAPPVAETGRRESRAAQSKAAVARPSIQPRVARRPLSPPSAPGFRCSPSARTLPSALAPFALSPQPAQNERHQHRTTRSAICRCTATTDTREDNHDDGHNHGQRR